MAQIFGQSVRFVTVVALIGVASVAMPHVANAQMMNAESATEVRRAFVADLDSMQAQVVALANALPADKYSCRPAPGVRSVGDVFQHIASEYYLYTPMAYGLPPSTVIPSGPDAMAQFEKASTQADVLKHLAESFTFMRALVLGADVTALTGKRKLFGKERTIAETSLIMSGDLHEHLGQLIAYSRMNGIKPPWSK